MHSPAHPGRHIADELAHLGLSVGDAAARMQIDAARLQEVIDGADLPLDIAKALPTLVGSTAEHWARLQDAYAAARVV